MKYVGLVLLCVLPLLARMIVFAILGCGQSVEQSEEESLGEVGDGESLLSATYLTSCDDQWVP